MRYSLGRLTARRHGHLFTVNSSSGELYVHGDVDYEQSSVYYLTVIAADRAVTGGGGVDSDGVGAQSSTASVTV